MLGASGNVSNCKNGYGTGNNLGNNEDPYTAGDVDIGKNVLQVDIGNPDPALGRRFTCALTDEGKIRCFGNGTSGRLGTNNGNNLCPASTTMSDIAISETAIKVATGKKSSCAILNTGNVKCWGDGEGGATGYDHTSNLGNDAGEMEALSNVYIGGKTATDISVGDASGCIVTNDGRARCWGKGDGGRLGTNSTSNVGNNAGSNSMTLLGDITIGVGDPKVKKIKTKISTTCALTVNDTIRCWGNGDSGRLGTGSTSKIGNSSGNSIALMTDVNVDSSADDSIVDFSVAGASVCVTNSSGQVKCWGNGDKGQLGNGGTSNTGSSSPSTLSWRNIAGSKTVKQLAGGSFNAANSTYCALTDDLEIHCWGHNDAGQLGVGNTTNHNDITTTTAAKIWGP